MYQPAAAASDDRFIFKANPPALDPLRAAINALYLADETQCVDALLTQARLDAKARAEIQARAKMLVEAVRKNRQSKGGIEEFLRQYDLSSQEGMVLMCLAEAFLRIPDADTADKLIRDKIVNGNWSEHLGASPSLFVNASTWGLMLTGKLIELDQAVEKNLGNYVMALFARLGEPVVRAAFRQAMRIMGHQFVMGRTIQEALKRAKDEENRRFRHSYDMLGEAALTAKDAERYYQAYSMAIDAIGATVEKGADVFSAPSISVKLSALHPRYELAQHERVMTELVPKVIALAEQAKSYGMGLTVDAEESERLDLSLDIIEAVYRSPKLEGWEGFGLAVQAYQKRAYKVIDWLIALARGGKRRIPVRLVKGAYWDSEVKRGQERGLEGYPVFTRKASTDVSYLACARKMLGNRDALYPMFATHNAQTLSSVMQMAGGDLGFEFQRLHGMGIELYDEVVGPDKLKLNCRVYAPVGSHEDLLPYLVRRLLENGANTSFVNRIIDEKVPVDAIVADPVAEVEALAVKPHPRIPSPKDIYGPWRPNSRGVNLADQQKLASLAAEMQKAFDREWIAAPIVGGKVLSGKEKPSLNPVDNRETVGIIREADAETIRKAVDVAVAAQPAWDATPAMERARILRKAADLFETHTAVLMALCVREAGKSIPDAVSEVREAVDYLRYYAERAEEDFGKPTPMPGPTGESNELWLQGRGVFVCISPWNFPLAIFTGQVAAALAAGNAVLTKPAEQTSLIGAQAVRLMHEAGIPGGVLNFIPGRGSVVGQHAVADPRIAGVAFTGSTETAKTINQTLANRDGIIPVLIAETGGQNCMLVDSSALAEQVVMDVVASAFNSAGQRCSALRVLFVQEEIADRVVEVLSGYMDELRMGDPAWLSTDVGPVIDKASKQQLDEHKAWIKTQGKLIKELAVPAELADGTYVSPMAVDLPSLDILKREVFGPVLHVIRYKAADLDKVIDSINRTGYGLTLGIHSRIDSQAQYIQRRIRVGNVYINRNMIGAVVGVQPFGGQGLSGTGPKAGGPHYMLRFATERTVTVNTAAVGGNASLLSLKETEPAMAVSVFDMFKIGVGPSSSHTVGPMRAARQFLLDLEERQLFGKTAQVVVQLYGSLALTGKGHGTDRAILLGLEGETPDGVDPDGIAKRLDAIRKSGKIKLLGKREIPFDEALDLLLHRDQVLPKHSNGLRFTALDADKKPLFTDEFYSIGGGFIVRSSEMEGDAAAAVVKLPYPFNSGDELLAQCAKHKLSIPQLMLANEGAWRPETETRAGLLKIWGVMQACVARGMREGGELPGGLKVVRRAPIITARLAAQKKTTALDAMDWVNLWALAVNEENAAGGRVVTAPTNGAAGIIPSVMHYYLRFVDGADEEGILRFLLTAAAIGILYKQNASISGAEMGCQGEVGVACSMAAGGLIAAMQGSDAQIENAAEIGMEHNLGLTCDPVGGLVQIPCIERNAMGSVKAINAARLAMHGDGQHRVSLDQVISTMRQTGHDMRSIYKETSLGGLAVNVTEC